MGMRPDGDTPQVPRVPPDAGRGPGTTDADRLDREHARELQRERRNRVLKTLVALAILVVLIIFIVTNSQPVLVKFVFFDGRPRLIWVMFACAVLGGLVGYLVGRPGKQVRFHRSREERKK
jgi:uncharacterized integral membrane protein